MFVMLQQHAAPHRCDSKHLTDSNDHTQACQQHCEGACRTRNTLTRTAPVKARESAWTAGLSLCRKPLPQGLLKNTTTGLWAHQAWPSECPQQGRESSPYMCVNQPRCTQERCRNYTVRLAGWRAACFPSCPKRHHRCHASCAGHTTLRQQEASSIGEQSQYPNTIHVCDGSLFVPTTYACPNYRSKP
jgi:hypothetical protein